jgi:hypothetical protein
MEYYNDLIEDIFVKKYWLFLKGLICFGSIQV